MRRSLRLLAVLSLVLLMLPEALLARQQKAITGTVLSDEGSPMPGVTVRISGSNNRFTQTDVNGHYSIQASTGEVLE